MRRDLFKNDAAFEQGAYRRDDDPSWPPPVRAYGGRNVSPWEPVQAFLHAALRLALPTLLTLVLLAASYLYADAALPLAGWPQTIQGAGLTASDLILPLSWFAIHLTNRRFGPAYAFSQLLAVLVLGMIVVLADPYGFDSLVPALPLDGRAACAFAGAFLLANFIAITFFDGARGRHWWTAPLAGSFAASLVFSAVYYPAAFAGINDGWTDAAWVHFTLFFGVSILLLMPYCLLRPATRPVQGLNGY